MKSYHLLIVAGACIGHDTKIPPFSRSAAFARQIIDPAALFQRQINVIRRAEAKQRNKPKAHSVSTIGKITNQKERSSADGHQ